MSCNPPRPLVKRPLHSTAAGFTLVEMLVVVALLSLLVTMAAMSVPAALGSQRLSGAARQLSADLNQASLLARKEDKLVEMRFYELLPTTRQGTLGYRAYQIGLVTGWASDGKPQVTFSSELQRLPDDVLLLPDARYNTLQSQAVHTDGAAGGEQNVSYVSYFLHVNGSTTLPANQPAVITLVRELSKGVPSGLPDDFRSIVIDPGTHQTRVY